MTTPAIFSICTVSGGRFDGKDDITFKSCRSAGRGGTGGTGPSGLFHRSSESESSNVPVDKIVAEDASYVPIADKLNFSFGNAWNEGREDGWPGVVDVDVVADMDFDTMGEEEDKVDDAEVGIDLGGDIEVVEVDEAEEGSGSCLGGGMSVASPFDEFPILFMSSNRLVSQGLSSFLRVASLSPLPLLFIVPVSEEKGPNPSDNLFENDRGLCGLVGLRGGVCVCV